MKSFYFLALNADTAVIFADNYDSNDSLEDALEEAWSIWPCIHLVNKMPPVPIKPLPDESTPSLGQLSLPFSSECECNEQEISE